jgi:TonB family protein
MRVGSIVLLVALIGWPVAAGAQTSNSRESALTPRQVVDAPKEATGAKVGESRVAYEWRDPFGLSEPVLVIGPSLQDTKFIAPAGSSSILDSEPRVLSGTVRSVVPSSGLDGKGGLAVVVDDVSIAPLPLTEKHRLTSSLEAHSFVPAQGASLPVVVKDAKPVYPPGAIASRKEGTVELELIVAPDGTVSDVRVTKSLDEGGPFDKAAIAAAKLWLFKPGAKDGVPVPTKVSLVLDFKVKK